VELWSVLAEGNNTLDDAICERGAGKEGHDGRCSVGRICSAPSIRRYEPVYTEQGYAATTPGVREIAARMGYS
jgi:hypothetical protein